jgi:hypothetical protein
MRIRTEKIPSALKHGLYTATDVLPGEDPVKFAKLHRDLITEFVPSGALEDDIVATIARLTWRKQNLATLRIATLAKARRDNAWHQIYATNFPMLDFGEKPTEEEIEKRKNAYHELIQKEPGFVSDLVEVGEAATFGGLTTDMELEEKFGSMIDKCLKRLLFLRGLKSISIPSVSSAPKQLGANSSKAA